MREIYISAATLAGLVGLSLLYNGGEQLRMKREAGLAALQEDHINVTANMFQDTSDYDFLKSIGWLDEGASIPDQFVEDVRFYQDEAEKCEKGDEDCVPYPGGRSGSRKSIQFVAKCMRNDKCKRSAIESVASWGTNNRRYMEANVNVLLHPIATSFDEDASTDMGICTSSDHLWACNDAELSTYEETFNDRPTEQLSAHTDVQQTIEDLTGESTGMHLVLESLATSNPGSARNVFGSGSGGMKIVLVIPNGIPVHMSLNYQSKYQNYWNFFKNFNSKYIGIDKNASYNNRNNFHFWFVRQDKQAKFIMSTPAKANKRFPWNRFDSLMGKVQPTAIQPKFRKTFEDISKTIMSKNYGAEKSEGQDCVIMWFHHYIPQDLLEIADSSTQEDISFLDDACTVIHFWVGMTEIDGDQDTIMVVKYLQGILQPSQISKTSADYELRQWHYVENLDSMDPGSADQAELMSKVYNDIALDRRRVKCLLSTSGKGMAAAVESIGENNAAKESDYDFYYGITTDPYPTSGDMGLSIDPDLLETVGPTEGYTVAEVGIPDDHVPDWSCCGRGFQGRKYDSVLEECCETGAVVDLTDEDGCYI